MKEGFQDILLKCQQTRDSLLQLNLNASVTIRTKAFNGKKIATKNHFPFMQKPTEKTAKSNQIQEFVIEQMNIVVMHFLQQHRTFWSLDLPQLQ